jgi:hypothetical protein
MSSWDASSDERAQKQKGKTLLNPTYDEAHDVEPYDGPMMSWQAVVTHFANPSEIGRDNNKLYDPDMRHVALVAGGRLTEIRDRRGTVLPASRAMQRLWHRDREAFPEGTAFKALGELAGDAGWSRRAAAGLRAHLHRADEELRRLRSLEMEAASEKRRQAAIDSFWTGGGLRRFLHPPSPSLHSPIIVLHG